MFPFWVAAWLAVSSKPMGAGDEQRSRQRVHHSSFQQSTLPMVKLTVVPVIPLA
jgi:hypothetical protein